MKMMKKHNDAASNIEDFPSATWKAGSIQPTAW